MVVNHVHDDPKTVPVQRLHQLLQFLYPHLPVGGIGGIGAFRHIVADRIIAPVKLVPVSGLIDGAEIIDRHQLDMGHAQLL